MNMHLVQASRSVREVFSQFLKQVVDPAIRYERLGVLEEKQRAKIEQGLMTDIRPVRLLVTSGKGGWHPDPQRAAHYAKSQNVSWLDHSLSVVRGALLFYAIERVQRAPDMDQTLLARRLRWIAVIGFLHDFDKLPGLARNQDLPLDELSLRWQRYHISEFLAEDSTVDLAQIRFLIELVEDTQRQRNLPAQLPSPELKALVPFIALADKLDGIWLSTDPIQGGVDGLLRYLARTDLLQYEPLRHWQAVDIFDPHHPFLLEELQNCLSISCRSKQLAGIPPLIETHLDGRLFMLLPKNHYSAICEQALKRLRKQLPFDLEINISNRGVPTLINGCPDQAAVFELLKNQDNKQLAGLFRIKSDLQSTLTANLDQLLAELDLQPRWPKVSGATCSPYANLDRSSLSADALEPLYLAAYLALLLNHRMLKALCSLPTSYDEREQTLLQHIALERPLWISEISDQASRLVITALWVSCMAYHDQLLKAALIEENGLLLRWLEGDGELAGLNVNLEGRGTQISAAVERHLRQLLNQQRVHTGDEHTSGRCLFTDQPVSDDWIIDEKLGLYEVKVSAFSGRDGRVESPYAGKPNTLVSPVSVAEYRLRTQRAKQRTGKEDGVPTLIYSPSTLGLFAGLLLEEDRQAQELSIYDLAMINAKPGKLLYHEGAILQHRHYVARYERIPEKLVHQLDSLRLLLKACLRLGRPIHVFRGLAVRETAFFYYDALPPLLSGLIGGNRLRLEQISPALERLELGRFILETPNLGYEVLARYANPASRLGAIALICCQLKIGNNKSNPNQLLSKLEQEFLSMSKQTTSNSDGALVRLGQAACMIQRYPGYSASNNEEQLVFDLCLDSVLAARRVGQTDQRSLILAVAGELRTNLDRKDKVAASKHRAGKSLLDACVDVAELFVTQVWYGALKECPPNQSNRRILTSIYRMAFLLNSKRDSETVETA